VTAGQTTTLVRFLMVGTLLNCFMLMPYGLQIAYGWTRLAVYSNLVALAIDIPLLIVLIGRYGAVGAASVWVLLNLGYFVISVNIIHTRLLPSEKWRWYGGDVLAPLFAVAVVVGTMRFLLPSVAGVPRLIGVVGATMAMATGAAMLAAPEARKRLLAVLR
jgi:O-antigen/teichoic acid export membrane protein